MQASMRLHAKMRLEGIIWVEEHLRPINREAKGTGIIRGGSIWTSSLIRHFLAGITIDHASVD